MDAEAIESSMLHFGNMLIAYQIRSNAFASFKRDIALLCKAAIYSLSSESECDILTWNQDKAIYLHLFHKMQMCLLYGQKKEE